MHTVDRGDETMKRSIGLYVCYMVTILAVLIGAKILNRTVTVMAANQIKEGKVCIIIDPGHGGEDGGAVSVTGKPESTYNLEISVRLNDMLKLLGYETRMTRDADISIYTKGENLAQKKVSDLKERVRIINDTDNALLLSIHQNHFPEEKYAGPQVFFSASGDSEQLAKHLQSILVSGLSPGSKRSAKKASRIYLMEHIRCTGVLVECGFLSNYREEAALRDPQYQKKVSSLIAAGVSQYLSNT